MLIAISTNLVGGWRIFDEEEARMCFGFQAHDETLLSPLNVSDFKTQTLGPRTANTVQQNRLTIQSLYFKPSTFKAETFY